MWLARTPQELLLARVELRVHPLEPWKLWQLIEGKQRDAEINRQIDRVEGARRRFACGSITSD